MPKVTLVQLVYNGMEYLPDSIGSLVVQTHTNKEIIVVINGNEDGSKQYIEKNFPEVKIIDPRENLKFARGHNLVFGSQDADFFQLVNQDLILEPNYVEEILKVFVNPKVGAANGKIFQYDFRAKKRLPTLDTTGVVVYKSGRARSRGQNELDTGQFNNAVELMAVDGAACMFRKSALEAVKYKRPDGRNEYFDEDMDMYWEDVDLSWRMVNAGLACRFAPGAIGFHGRTASASPGGYKKVWSFVKHHRKIAPWIRRLNYKNHIFLFLKNCPKLYWQFFAREFFYNIYVLIFEPSTLKILPKFFRQLPSIWQKRKFIKNERKISLAEAERLFS